MSIHKLNSFACIILWKTRENSVREKSFGLAEKFETMLISEKYVTFLVFFINCITQTMTANNRDWWKYTTIYEIFVWSFKDSNGDGIGDIKGNIMK